MGAIYTSRGSNNQKRVVSVSQILYTSIIIALLNPLLLL